MALPPALQARRDTIVAAEVDNPSPNPLDPAAPQTDQINGQQAPQQNVQNTQQATQQNPQQPAPVNADAAAEAAANQPLHQDPELAAFFGDATPGQAQQAAPQQTTQPTQPAQYTQAPQAAPAQNPQGFPQNVDTDALAVVRAQQQIIDMMARNNAGQTQAAPQQQEAPAPFFDIQTADLTPEEQQFFNGREDLFRKLVANEIRKHVADPINRLATQTQEAAQSATTHATNAEQRAFAMSLQARIPDVQTVYRTPQFATFLDEYVPEAGASRRELLTNATKTYNVGLIEAHVNEFKRRNGAQPTQSAPNPAAGQAQPQAQRGATQTTPAPAGMVQPQSNPTQAVPQQAQPRRVITPEKLQEAQQLMMRGKLSGDKFNKLVAAFKDQQQEQLQSMGYQGNA